MFKTKNIKIKGQDSKKEIYISMNLLFNYYNNSFFYEGLTTENLFSHLITDRLCFVEFENFILIELEMVGLNYYSNYLPVYDYNGFIINPVIDGEEYKIKKLDFDDIFLQILKPIYYFNINSDNSNKIKEAINDIEIVSLGLLKINSMKLSLKRYIYHQFLVDRFEKINVDTLFKTIARSAIIHTENAEPIIKKDTFKFINIFIKTNYFSTSDIAIINQRNIQYSYIGGKKYQEKYLKYKQKYNLIKQ
jgi:hypothetical protein